VNRRCWVLLDREGTFLRPLAWSSRWGPCVTKHLWAAKPFDSKASANRFAEENRFPSFEAREYDRVTQQLVSNEWRTTCASR
jgi:hypothetical protein